MIAGAERLHILMGPGWQPLAEYEVLPRLTDKPLIIHTPPEELWRCDVCHDERRACELMIRSDSFGGSIIKCADECFTGARRARLERE